MSRVRQLAGRLPDDLMSLGGRTSLAELDSSGLLRRLTERVVADLYDHLGVTCVVAHTSLVVSAPGLEPREFTLRGFPSRRAQACAAQVTACIHPIGCRPAHATIDPGSGAVRPLEPGDVVVTAYPHGTVFDAVHRVGFLATQDAQPCTCIYMLLTEA